MGKLFADNITFRNGQLVVEEDGMVQEIIVTSDTKQFFTTAVNEFFMQDDPDTDLQWQEIFRVIPGRGHGELFPFRPKDATTTVTGTDFLTARDEATTGSHGIVFNEVGEAGEIKFSRVVSAEKYVKHIKYATAIGYSNEWFSDGQMSLIEMVTEDFRRSAGDKMAAIHYGAIVAAVDAGLSSSTAATTGTSNVANIINAANSIVTAMRRAKRRPEILLIAPENEQAVRLAFKTTGVSTVVAVQNDMTARLRIMVTEYIAANTAYVIEPKRRLISTNRLPLALGNFQDLLHDSEVLVGKFRRGVLVGEAAVIHAMTSVPSTVDSTMDF
jgi:hypothetical protein